jgi:hypothetical protein
METPKDCWAAWVEDGYSGETMLIGFIPQNTDEEMVDWPDWANGVHENRFGKMVQSYRKHVGHFEWYLEAWLSYRLKSLKFKF